MGKTKPQSMRLLKDKLWRECKRITRERWGNVCYTCNSPGLEGSNWQTGHGKPMAILPLRFQYDIRNLRPQCSDCNIWKSGMTDIFIGKLEQEEEGYAFLMESCRFDEKDGVWRVRRDYPSFSGTDSRIFIQNLIQEYRDF